MTIYRRGKRSIAEVSAALVVLLAAVAWGGARHERNQPDCFERAISGHTDGVLCLAYLPDGVRFVSGSADKTVKLWDSSTGDMLHSFEGHEKGVLCVAVSPDGKYIASGGYDKTIRVWEISSGQQIAQLEGHTFSVTGVYFLDDTRLSSAGGDGFRIWDFKNEKLLTKTTDGPRILKVAYSKDGTRAALVDWFGFSAYWDTVACRQIAPLSHFHFIDAAGISPDGKHVYFNAEGKWSRYDADDGHSVPMPPEFVAGDSFAFTADQKRLIAAAASPAYVWDIANSKRIASLLGNSSNHEIGHALAVSNDGRHILYGTGGAEGGDGWHPGQENKIFLFDLSKLNASVSVGPREGSVSWDVIPAQVKTKNGKLTPLDEYFAKTYYPPIQLRQGGKGFDVIWSMRDIFLHRTPGILEPVLQEEANFRDVQWDGKYIWVSASQPGSLIVLDQTGNLIARAGPAEGMRGFQYGVTDICVLGEGKVLLAGAGSLEKMQPGRGWCAVAEIGPDGKSIKVKNLLQEPSQMPPGWTTPTQGDWPAFNPRNIFVLQTTGGPVAYITCNRTPQSPMPVVKVNVRTLAVSLYNVPGVGEEFGRSDRLTFVPIRVLSESEILGGDGEVRIFTAGDHSFAQTPTRLVAEWQDPGSRPPPVLWDGQVVFPGHHWRRIDRKDWNPEDLGTGLRVDGDLVELNISYGVSAHFGLCAISSLDGAFYRFSIDPAHPRSIRATRDVDFAPPPGAEKGIVEHSPDHSSFAAGRGIIHVQNGRLFAMDYEDVNGREILPAASFVGRLLGSPDERLRIGLNDDQFAQIQAAGGVAQSAQPDEAKVRPLIDAFESAQDPDARKRAAQPLLAEAREFAIRKANLRANYISRVQSIFTPLQWKLLSYEHLTPEEAAQAKSLREQATVASVAAAKVAPSRQWPPSVIVGGLGLLLIGAALGIQKLRRKRTT